MHAAPSVTYPVGRSVVQAWLYLVAGAAALAMAALWTVQSGRLEWRQGIAFAVTIVWAALAVASWLRSPTGRLRWDGAQWWWEDRRRTEPGVPQVALDLQSRLVLHWRSDSGRRRWFWVEETSAPADWDALRRAVYSRASATGRRVGEPPAAEQ